jgi:protease-4
MKFIRSVFSTAIGVVLGSLASLVVGIILIALASRGIRQAGLEPVQRHSVLHLQMEGSLVERWRPMDFDFLTGSALFRDDHTIGLYDTLRALATAKADARFDGVYLDIGSLDAGWAGLTALRRGLKDFSASGKFVVAYSEQYDEKAYYLATGADLIYMQPNGELELNGLSMSEAFFKGLIERLEIEPKIFRVGRFKSAVEPFILEKMSAENRAQNQTLLNDIWGVARADFAAATKKPIDAIDRVAANLEAATPEAAEKLGLVKGLVYEDELRDMLADRTVGKDEEIRLVSVRHFLRDIGPSRAKKGKDGKIALVFADGEIVSGAAGRDRVGAESLVRDLRDAEQDDDVKAIVVRINSPGGDALASDVIWREIYSIDQDVPVVASMGDVAASGGYYMATGARYIFAEPTTITGSIGVFGLLFNAEKFFKRKVGVSFDRVATHPHAGIGEFSRPMDPVEAKYIQTGVERVYGRFLEVVKEGRGFEKVEDVATVAEGRVWSGLRAQELGLVDELGGVASAIKKAAEFAELGDGFQIEVYPKEPDAFTQIIERLSENATDAMVGPTNIARVARSLGGIRALDLPKPGIYARMPFDLEIK